MDQRVKVLSWNLGGYTMRSGLMADCWAHLTGLDFDIALLQEADVDETLLESPRLVGPRKDDAWSYVYVPEWPATVVDDLDINLEHGRVAAAQVTMPHGQLLLAASVHTTPTQVAPHNDFIFKLLCARFQGVPHVIGGDLNSARKAEKHRWDWVGHLGFFESVGGRGLSNCLWDKHGHECQTYFPRRGQSFQDDHILASTDPALRVVSARVPDPGPIIDATELTPRISDHIPIEVELELASR